jgi:hypothetical protein
MAEFLTTQGTSYHLENVIINAKEWLILISPYLNITENFLQRLQDADKRKVKIYIVYGKDELKSEEKSKLQILKNLTLRFCRNLHAKCYLNESSIIITSMNMYAFSEKNNREMGILVRKDSETDRKLYEDAMKEINSILDSAIPDTSAIGGSLMEMGKALKDIFVPLSGKNSRRSGLKHGFCIRCRKEIINNPDKPYCSECYNSWSEWKNPDYIEKFCHSCGKRDDSSMLYPLCRPCFQKSQRH